MPDETVFEDHDELMRQMELDEIADATKATPREYAKSRGLAPQNIYYHIRNGHIKKEQCICGRTVIDIDAADQYLQLGEYKDEHEDS
jgi:hypothetical protein